MTIFLAIYLGDQMTHYAQANREVISVDVNLIVSQEFASEDFKVSIDEKQYHQISNMKKGLNATTGPHPPQDLN